MALAIGEKAPDFTLPSDEGRDISLHDYEGQKVILYFYPKDNTSGAAPWRRRPSGTIWRILKSWDMQSLA